MRTYGVVAVLFGLLVLITGSPAMGYTLHIERVEESSDGRSGAIAVEEWLALVKEDRDLQSVETAEATNPRTGEKVSLKIPNSASWVDADGRTFYFVYSRGKIKLDNPPEEAIRKMKELAESLNAQVVGDEGEKY